MVDAVDKVGIRGRGFAGLGKGGSDLCAHVLRRGETGCVYIKNAGIGAGLGQLHHLGKGDAQLFLHTLDDPQTHDVFQVADVPHATLVGKVCTAALRAGDGFCQLDPQQTPCAGREERRIPLLHGNALHGAGGVVGGAQHHLGLPAHLGGNVGRQRPQHRAGCGQLGEHRLRQAQSFENLRVVLFGLGVHKAGGGGIGVLAGFHAAQLPQQIFRDHQKVLGLGQPPGCFVGVQLINAVEGLELDAGALVKLFKGQDAVYFGNDRLRPAVAVSVDRINRLIVFQQHIINGPCINGKALDIRIFCKGFPDALLHVGKQAVDVPFQMTVHPLDAVGEPIHFFGAENAVLHPSHNVPPAGRTDVDGKMVFVHNAPPVWPCLLPV